jgi:hypothetical protein
MQVLSHCLMVTGQKRWCVVWSRWISGSRAPRRKTPYPFETEHRRRLFHESTSLHTNGQSLARRPFLSFRNGLLVTLALVKRIQAYQKQCRGDQSCCAAFFYSLDLTSQCRQGREGLEMKVPDATEGPCGSPGRSRASRTNGGP